MITDKILIFFINPININMGGPSGFIAQNLIGKDNAFYIFPEDLYFENRFRTFVKLFYKKRYRQKESMAAFIFKEIKAKNYKYIFFMIVKHLNIVKI